LNDNKVEILRELAAQAIDTPPLYYPMRRVGTAVHEAHTAAASSPDGSLSAALREGFAPPSTAGDSNPNRAHVAVVVTRRRQSSTASVYTTSEDLHAAFRAGSTTPSKVVELVLARVEASGAFSSVLPSLAREAAAASTTRWADGSPLGVLDGVPMAVKDMIAVKGLPMFKGKVPSAERRASVEAEDDEMVARLRAQGAVIIGLTVMTEGGVTPLGYAPFFRGPFNPHNASHYPGGSSSGSGVAVALGLTPIAVGFDGGGSIRIPAALSGTVGLAATFGRVPFRGTMSTMIKTGVLAATVRDAALAFAAIAPTKPDHHYTRLYGGLGPPEPHLRGVTAAPARLDGVRLGIFRAHAHDADQGAVDALTAGLEHLESLGAVVVEIAIPNLHALSMAHGMKTSTEFALEFDKLYHDAGASSPALEANTRLTVGLGSSMTALEVLAGERLRGWAFDYVTKELFAKLRLTAIVGPTTGILAPRIPPGALETGEYNVALVMKLMRHIFLANLLGLPAIAVPVGHDEETQLPWSMQLMGDHWSEAELLRVARVLEEKFTNPTGRRRTPPGFVSLL
jgi:Asp-tRNA(Asn)/Glu-tRNA(Gln) amidotransferase A subunit family amidase